MRFPVRAVPSLLWSALRKFLGDGGPGMAGALSFSAVFSLPALLALLLMVAGRFMDPRTVSDAIVAQFGALVGPAAADQIATIIARADRSDVSPTLTAVLGLATVLFGSTATFASLQNAINKTWNVKPDPRRGEIRNFLVKRIFSFGIVLVVAFLLLISLAVSAVLSAISERTADMGGVVGVLARSANVAFSLAVVTALFGAMFKILPDALVCWRDIWAGAFVTTLLFVGGKELIGMYLGTADPGSAFGAAGSLALVLLWIYYSSWIVLYGAEFTRLWADTVGGGVRPERGAIEYVEQEKTVDAG